MMNGDRSSGDESRMSKSSNSTVRKWVRFDDTAGPETTIDETFDEQSSTVAADDQQRPKKPYAPPRRLPPVGKEKNSNEDVAQIDVKLEESPHSRVSLAGSSKDSPSRPTSSHSVVSQTYSNGKIITTILPDNKYCTWFSPSHFNPYKMPKSLISEPLTMPVEDFVTSMEMLTNDFRFRSYTVCYRRLIAGWLVFSLFILIGILVSGMRGLLLFGVTLIWLFFTGAGVLGCLYVKKLINEGLFKCVASVNKLLMRYNLLVGVEDRGKISCHKIAIMFVYFDVKNCLPKIVQSLSIQDTQSDGYATHSVPSVSLTVDPAASLSYGRNWNQEEKAENLILKCSQSYIKALIRHRIQFPSRPSQGASEFSPLHCSHSYCICQYLQKYYFEKKPKSCCPNFFLSSEIPSSYYDAAYHPGVLP